MREGEGGRERVCVMGTGDVCIEEKILCLGGRGTIVSVDYDDWFMEVELEVVGSFRDVVLFCEAIIGLLFIRLFGVG